jgi:hypothetical protein
MTNIERITKLTEKWYVYVNLDHHKSRDCVWSIDISYSYGEKPKYYAYHNGYILDDWRSPECDTLEDAEAWMINKLERELKLAHEHLLDVINGPADEIWFDQNRAKEIIKEIFDES